MATIILSILILEQQESSPIDESKKGKVVKIVKQLVL
ncbi:Uncharacterised protein [Enterococcus faecalis]|uniref:Uncharacterized protein n=1 Tax=Enterococcus faecalis TaxID=1351 RepID=A0AAX2KVA1_ENTFL|nr:Uncharacterised protein [Enterococcus faecalis]